MVGAQSARLPLVHNFSELRNIFLKWHISSPREAALLSTCPDLPWSDSKLRELVPRSFQDHRLHQTVGDLAQPAASARRPPTMPGLGADESRTLLDSHDLMESALSILTFYLHRGSAQQKLSVSTADHIGLLENGKINTVSYKDLLLSRVSCGTEEWKVYGKYMGFAEREYIDSSMAVHSGNFELDFLRVSPTQFRSELTNYFSPLKNTSGRNEEAHRFSRALKFDSKIKSSDSKLIQYVLQDTPSVEATKDPLNTELLGRLESLFDFDKLPESVKQPLVNCRTFFELHVRYLWIIFDGGALKAEDGKHPDEAPPRTDQEDADGWTAPGKNHRVSAKSRA